MNKDTIYREAAINEVKKHYRAYDNDLLELISFALKALPSARPEITRCEDCRFWERESISEGHCLEIDLYHVDEDHYCSFAERRTDERPN